MNLNICFIIPTEFGIPAINGGAVETLVDTILEENKVKGLCDISVVTSYNEAIGKTYVKENHVEYLYIKNNFLCRFLIISLGSLLRKLFKFNLQGIIWQILVYIKLKDKKFDVVIVETSPFRGLYSHWRRFLNTKKFIHHIHSEPNLTNRMKKIYDGFLVISPYIYRQSLKSEKKEKIFLLNNCVDVKKFSKRLNEIDAAKERNKYGILKEKFVFLFCGRTIAEKGVKELIQAFKVMKYKKNSVLLITGNANFADSVTLPYDKELAGLAKGEKNIIFTGYIPNGELYRLHSIANSSVVPSIWEEPMGLVVVEGLCSGNAMIVSDSGSIPDFVDQDSAIIVKRGENFVNGLASAMEYLFENPDVCKKMGEKGIRIAQQYDKEAYYKNFLEGMKYFLGNNE